MNYGEQQFNQMEREAAEAADIRRQCRDEYLASLDPRKAHSMAYAVATAVGTLNALHGYLDAQGMTETAASAKRSADDLLEAWKAHIKVGK
jgi:hypothetical protein